MSSYKQTPGMLFWSGNSSFFGTYCHDSETFEKCLK